MGTAQSHELLLGTRVGLIERLRGSAMNSEVKISSSLRPGATHLAQLVHGPAQYFKLISCVGLGLHSTSANAIVLRSDDRAQ